MSTASEDRGPIPIIGSVLSLHLPRPKYRHEPDECSHMKVVVDRERCVVECGDCGSQLDPFAVLLRYALEETSLRGLIERKTSIDKEYEERRTIKNSTCRHTRARQMSTGVWYCPSCDLQWNKAISMKTKEATDA